MSIQGAIGSAASGAGLGTSILPGIGTAVGGILGGIAGLFGSSGDRDKADEAMRNAFNEINQLGLPPDQSKEIFVKHLQAAGVYNPKVEQALDAGVSKLSQVQEDSSLKDAQMQALKNIQQRAKVGLTAEDKLALAKVQQQAARDSEAKRQQIIQNMQMRGQAGGGAELAAQLAAQQAGAEGQAEQGNRVAAQASQNALQAMGMSGQLGSQIRQQDFGINAQKAQAADEMNRFNVSNQIGQQARNVAAQNQGQQMNLANAQRISDTNVNLDNAEQQRQLQAQRNYWEDLKSRATMRANAYKAKADDASGQAAQKQQGWQNIGSGVGTAAGSIFGALSGGKKAEEPFDAEKALREGHGGK